MKLIDADVLKEKLEKTADINNPKFSYDSMMIAKIMIQMLNKAPTVEERKRGHWIEHPEHPIGDCSVCGERVPIYSGSKKYKNCPYCGAKMDGMNILKLGWLRSEDMNYPDLIKWIFEFVYEHWILTFLFILALRRFSIFTINLSDKKSGRL